MATIYEAESDVSAASANSEHAVAAQCEVRVGSSPRGHRFATCPAFWGTGRRGDHVGGLQLRDTYGTLAAAGLNPSHGRDASLPFRAPADAGPA